MARTRTLPIPIPTERLAAVCRRYRVQRLVLFGSALREDFGPDGDIDLLVTFEPDAEVGFLALGQMRRALMVIFGRPVDLVPLDDLKPQIRDSVLAGAEVLYAL